MERITGEKLRYVGFHAYVGCSAFPLNVFLNKSLVRALEFYVTLPTKLFIITIVLTM